ncbi:magnesium transporter CorA family protein [Asticcacaulis solisilvae]|uniref:magnesium transporter CorA family protein n=1 Tax=Asticcacaulis solisilvae TaxID=1217274 RepID=UPI003FD8686A
MMTVFHRVDERIEQVFVRPQNAVPENPVWIDLNNPSFDEEKRVKALLGIAIPNREEIWRNHVTNHMYAQGGVAYMNAAVIHKTDSSHPRTSAITFIVARSCLVTIRYIYPTSFEHFQRRLTANPGACPTPDHVLTGLLEEMVARVAYHADLLDEGLSDLAYRIFDNHTFENKQGNPSIILRQLLQKLGNLNQLNAKIFESLNSLLRLQTFHRDELGGRHPDVRRRLVVLLHETQTLADQSNFLSSQISFQLDVSLGMISVEQNLISKIFTIAAVFFLPPTLISSIYGMNFEHMPELHWFFGYPLALTLMVLAAAGTFVGFRNKGWL